MDLRGVSGDGRAELSFLLSRVPEVFDTNTARIILDQPSQKVSQKLASWTKSGYLSRIKRGTYVQIPMNVEDPQKWLGDEYVLALALWPNSYFTGWTSANHWGLTEQVFRTLVVRTSDRVRAETSENLRRKFIVKHSNHLDLAWGIANEWRDGKRLAFADPSRTIVEVLEQPELGGGMRLVTEMVHSYLDDFEISKLVSSAEKLGKGTVYKRLGYLLELANYSDSQIIDALATKVTKGITLLDPAGPNSGERIMKWNLRINTKLARSNS
jgi:predicted transcriptional regulator of viral defense system